MRKGMGHTAVSVTKASSGIEAYLSEYFVKGILTFFTT